jgi:hypothetical protein
MAKEDFDLENDSSVAGKPRLGESTSVEFYQDGSADFTIPEFERQRTHKTVNFDKPVRCAKKNCRLSADMRAEMHGQGPKNYCFQHWAKIEPNTDTYDPDTTMIIRPEYGEEIRGEDRVMRQRMRGVKAAEEFIKTGIHNPVRTPGNPREASDPEAEIQTEDPITPIINRVALEGGRSTPNQLPVNYKNVMHNVVVRGAPGEQGEQEIREELRRNPSTRTTNKTDEIENLMKPGN